MTDTARIVADADVLAADLFLDGSAREVLDAIRAHDWLTLVATPELLDDAEAVIERLGDDALAADWRARIEDLATLVDQPAGDRPALAAAYRGDAAHLLTTDGRLTSIETNATLKPRVETSIKTPDAFARLLDPDSLYEALHENPYPGPDRDPRA
ncbi:DUF7384 family protein [Halocalculus aciditolerans]|uniref:PIN domain-containing protein n=1 Tax=Halocalculus aciditolerans TaxID=1383812 RepID=A0A830F816_9EURY|nr:hypothetical protein [Halocalculus aciditolerans]GGL49551.1 hypothetical protein GCM10009039_04640 [Halocalculus aciditolerans]